MASGLDGVAALERKLKALSQLEQGKAIRQAVRDGIRPAEQQAKARIPVGTGFAKRSVRVETTVSRDKQSASALLGVRREAFYATQFVELGNSRMAAQPWLRPAFESTRSQQEAGIAKGLEKAIDKASKTR